MSAAAAAAAAATRAPLGVHRLELHDNPLCSAGGAGIAVGLGANPPLTMLTLSDCNLDDAAGVAVARSLEWCVRVPFFAPSFL